MRKALPVAVICLAATFAFAATLLLAQTQSNKPAQDASAAKNMTPLNVNTGLWQMTQKVTWTGLPPQYASLLQNGVPHQYKSCVKPKDLSTNPWADGSGQKCSWTTVSSSGSDMEVTGTMCDMGKDWGMTADVHGKIHIIDSQNGTGSFDVTLTGNGQTAHGHADYTGKWIGATCAGTE